MKRKVRNKAMLVLILCMLFSMFVVNVSAADEPTSVVDNCERVVKSYDYDVAIGYINDKDETTYPKMDNYLFAGWYTDADCKTEYWGKATPGDTVYALFVPSHILSVKAQISANLLDDSADKTTASIRFVTTVDTLLYSQVGFDVSYEKNGTAKELTKSSNTVYKALYAVGKSSEKDAYTENGVIYRPWSSFCKLSSYFKACTINKIPTETNYETQFTVKPFWYTMDGSKVYGETTVKSVSEYFLANEVYVSATGNDETGTGTSDKPFATLNTAIANVRNGGTVHIIGDVTVAADATWEAHGKSVTITNDGDDSTTDALTFAATTVDVKDSVKFTGLELNFQASTTDAEGTVTYTKIFAWGNTFEIASDVTGLTNYVYVYGGGSEAITSDTNLILRAGNYQRIFGGGTAAVTGNTHVTLSGTINADNNYKSHGFSTGCLVFGGGERAVVTGDTNVTILDSTVYLNYIYGGGCYSAAKITGNCNVNFAGSAMSVYGGGYNGSVTGNTKVTMTDGWVEQIFGGCEAASVTGNTDVQVLGGEVVRRIYGGCYNDYTGTWETEKYVTGYASVTIGAQAEASLDTSSDTGLLAVSRYKTTFDNEEWGVLIFNDDMYDNTTWNLSSEIGSSYFTNNQAYHYLVKANAGGEVHSAGDFIYIQPDDGNVATVTIDGEVKHYTKSYSYYQLPTLDTSTNPTLQEEIIVTFSDTTPDGVDTSNCEARINGAYYNTLEEAIAAVSTTEPTTITLLKDTIEVETVTTVEANKNVLINVDESLSDKTVTINRQTDFGRMFVVNSAGKLTIQDIVLDGRITTELGQTTDLTSDSESLILCNGTLNLEDVTVQYAINSGDGGAIYINSDSAIVNLTGTSGSTMAKNENCSAKRGGAIFIKAGKVNATNYAFNNNKTTGDGGAILDNSSGSTYSNCTFLNNESGANGGAYKVHNASSDPLFTACVFNDNNANIGSAIYVNSSNKTTLINTVFQGEIAQKVYVAADKYLYFNNITGAVLVAGADTSNFIVSGYQDGNEIEFTPSTYKDGQQVLQKAEEMEEADFQVVCSAITVTPDSEGTYWRIDKEGKLFENPVASIQTGSTTEYYKTLADAIEAVTVTEQTTITLLQETIEIDAQLSISSTQNILIKADESLSDETVTICRNSESINMFNVAAAGTLTIQDIALDGRITSELEQTTDLTTGSKSLIICKGTLNLDDVTVQYAISSGDGGAIYINSDSAVVNLIGTSGSSMAKIENCSAKRGGAIFIMNGKVNATNYAFNTNKATNNSSYNNGTGGGGAILDNSSGSTYTSCTFSGNESVLSGGAYKVHAKGATPVFTDCNFNNNKAEGYGSAIYARYGTTTLVDAIFEGNVSQKVYAEATLDFNNITGVVLVDGASSSNFVVSGYQDGNIIEYIPYEYTNGIQVLNKAEELDQKVFHAACGAINVPCSADGKYWSIGVDGKLVDNTVASIMTGEDVEYFTSLEAAVASANDNGGTGETEPIEIVVLQDASITELFNISKNMTILNASGESVTISRGTEDADDMFDVAADATLTLGTNDTSETGELIIDGATTSAIAGRTVTVNAGAGFVLAKNATLQNANSTSDGAAVHTASNNTTIYGTIHNNVTTEDGGGLFADANASIEGATISSNQAGAAGGGINIASGAEVTCTNATFAQNKGLSGTSTWKNGGAVYCAGKFIDNYSQYIGNEAKNGGAVFVNNANAIVTLIGTDTLKGQFKNNKSSDTEGKGGGAIYVANAKTVSVDQYIFEGNTSDNSSASAIYIPKNKAITLNNVTFQGDTKQIIYVLGTLNYSKSTVILTNAEIIGTGTIINLDEE